MGRIAAEKSNVVIVTSDNPRTEIAANIIDEIVPGVSASLEPFDGERGYLVLEGRAKAIARAVSIAKKGDVIVIAGKGHEDYQILGNTRIHFDDIEILKKELEG